MPVLGCRYDSYMSVPSSWVVRTKNFSTSDKDTIPVTFCCWSTTIRRCTWH